MKPKIKFTTQDQRTCADLFLRFSIKVGSTDTKKVLHSRLFAAAAHVISPDYDGNKGAKWQADHISPVFTFSKYTGP
jgi:hypothetical protein